LDLTDHIRYAKGKPKFVELLEGVKLATAAKVTIIYKEVLK